MDGKQGSGEALLAAVGGGSGSGSGSEHTIAAQYEEAIARQADPGVKQQGGHDSPMQQRRDNTTTTSKNEEAAPSGYAAPSSHTAPPTVMGPPAAPASMFWTFKPGERAKKPKERVTDPYVACRLALVVVILFRAGDIKYAKILGQFAVDILGKEEWHNSLPQYLEAQPERDEITTVIGLLQEVRGELKVLGSHCLVDAAYLEGVMAAMTA